MQDNSVVTLSGDEICWKQKFFIKATNYKVTGNHEQKSVELEYNPKIEFFLTYSLQYNLRTQKSQQKYFG